MQIDIRAQTVSVVVLRRAGEGAEVLLLRKPDAGFWEQVAGSIEPGETGSAAAFRVLEDGTGFRPAMLWAADFTEIFCDPAADRIELVPVFVALVAADAEPRLSSEHDAGDWLTLLDAAERVSFPNQRALLAHVAREFVDRAPPGRLAIPRSR